MNNAQISTTDSQHYGPNATNRNIDNRPAWMTTANNVVNDVTPPLPPAPVSSSPPSQPIKEEHSAPPGQPGGNLFVLSGSLLHTAERVPKMRPIPIAIDNNLPAISVRLGTSDHNEIKFRVHTDSCAAMNVGNLRLHQWVITNHPIVVEKYLQFDDDCPFEPLQLNCAIDEESKRRVESTYGKLTAIVVYKTRYSDATGKQVTLEFGLGEGVAVNAIIGKPTLKAWKANLDFDRNFLTAKELQRDFPLDYTEANTGMPEAGKEFTVDQFERPYQSSEIGKAFLIAADADNIAITDSDRHDNN